jgi:hypothetical protein
VTAEASTAACAVAPSSETRLSDTLEVLSAGCTGDRISFDDLTSTLGDKCYAGLMFLLAAPNMLPTPPGTSAVLGVPLILLSAQLALGLRRPWFPALMLRRDVSTEKFAKLGERLEPWTRRAEALLTRRLDLMTGLVGRRLVGVVCLLLSLVLTLPIPFGDIVPAAAISLFALGLLTRDGLAVMAGLAATIASAVIVSGVGYGALEAGEWLFGRIGLA